MYIIHILYKYRLYTVGENNIGAPNFGIFFGVLINC